MDYMTIRQFLLDKIVLQTMTRWIITAILLSLYMLRILFSGSFFLVTYCLGIYLIHGTILFLTPKGDNITDPFENFEQDDDDFVPELIDNQFRPITRNLPEFEYWMFCTKVVIGAMFATLFNFMDIPVYTPILVIYFVSMVIYTSNCLYVHMKKYKYNPFAPSKSYYKD